MGFLPAGFLKPRNSKSRQHDRGRRSCQRDLSAHRPLRFEPLEDRCLLTALSGVLGLNIQLYQDVVNSSGNHVPGALIDQQTNPIQVGQSFFVEVVAEDYNDTGGGVISLPLNLSWNASVIQYADPPPAANQLYPAQIPAPSPSSPFSAWVTGDFTVQRYVTSLAPTSTNPTDTTLDGINGLSGAAIPNANDGSAIGALAMR